ncbi:MAG: serine/threonine-protein phosphatase [Proteobacteria bacterium]|nr:serine/threonine-protein phosphatase [Pseudomonadota bacterium]
MGPLDSLVQKQLTRLGLSPDAPPELDQWQKFLDRVSRHYKHVEEDRRLLNRSLELSSEEMHALQQRLRHEHDRLGLVVAAISEGLHSFHDAVALLRHSQSTDVSHIEHSLYDAKTRFSNRLTDLVAGDSSSPLSSDEARTIRNDFLQLADQLVQLVQVTADSTTLLRDLEVARAVQQMLVPGDEVIERSFVRMVGFFRPAAHCGGDWWSVYDLADDRVLTIIGDVTGHGIAPAILTGVAKATCDIARLIAGDQITCSQLLAAMNSGIYRAARQQLFMTCVASLFDPKTRTLTLANAGHNFPYLFRRQDGNSQLHHLVSPGNPLGASPDSDYESRVIDLAEGDVILWYTDGVTECENAQAQQFGEKRLRRVFQRVASSEPARVRDGIIDRVSSFCGTSVPADDMTMVVACVGQ